MSKFWTLKVRFLIKAEDPWKAWRALYDRLPETDDVLIEYDSMEPEEETTSQSSAPKVNKK